MSALERYFVEKPDVVLLDLVMKGMYGLDVLAKLREIDPAARVDRGVGRHPDLVARDGAGGGRRGVPQQAGRSAEQMLDMVAARSLEGRMSWS